MSKLYARGDGGAIKRDAALTEAKLALLAARERGDHDALAHALREHPAYADALTEFDLGLMATSGYADVENAPDVMEISQAARRRAFTAVFGAQPVVAQPALSLKALRTARGRSLSALASALGLGFDVVSALEAGRIRMASIPARLLEALGEALDTTAEQISASLAVNAAPALRRGLPGASAAANKLLDFSEAVMISQSMTQEQRARWLAESAEQ